MQDEDTNTVVVTNSNQNSTKSEQSGSPATKTLQGNDDTKVFKGLYLGISLLIFGVTTDLTLFRDSWLINPGEIIAWIGIIFMIVVTTRALIKIKTPGAKKTLGIIAVCIVLGLLANIVMESYRYK